MSTSTDRSVLPADSWRQKPPANSQVKSSELQSETPKQNLSKTVVVIEALFKYTSFHKIEIYMHNSPNKKGICDRLPKIDTLFLLNHTSNSINEKSIITYENFLSVQQKLINTWLKLDFKQSIILTPHCQHHKSIQSSFRVGCTASVIASILQEHGCYLEPSRLEQNEARNLHRATG